MASKPARRFRTKAGDTIPISRPRPARHRASVKELGSCPQISPLPPASLPRTSRARARAAEIARLLAERYPEAECALAHRNDFELLVATILSAQCTDKRVNMVTPELFRRFPTPQRMAGASQDELEALVRTTGFFRNKAKNIRECSRAIVERHGGRVPKTMDELVELPGVARKTANVVLGTAHGIASGVVVDTHVQRITRLLGLTKQTDPKKIEQDLMTILPESEWIDFSHRLIHHGRQVCIARRPACERCNLEAICPSSKLQARGLKPEA